MFKHITPYPWMIGGSGLTVWGYRQQYGQPLVTECKNRDMPHLTNRANAKLISIAPQMYEIIQKMHGNAEAMALVAYMEKSHED